MKSSPYSTVKKPLYGTSLLGVALAGITCLAQQAGAASVFTEVTDFGNSVLAATDLTAEFVDFSTAGKIIGSLVLGNLNSDGADYFIVNAPALSSVSIPTTFVSSTSTGYFGFQALTLAGAYISGNGVGFSMAGTVYNGTLSFTVPANGKVIIGTNHEVGDTTINYTLGQVPEPSAGLMSLAAVAAAALRRRREAL